MPRIGGCGMLENSTSQAITKGLSVILSVETVLRVTDVVLSD